MTNHVIPLAIPFSQLGAVHQYKTVNAGTTERIYYLKIPNSTVGFIQRIASNYFDNVKFKFIIDGAVVERNIERQLGPMNDPVNLVPPYLVKNYIELHAENNDTEAHIIDVLIDGICYHIKSVIGE